MQFPHLFAIDPRSSFLGHSGLCKVAALCCVGMLCLKVIPAVGVCQEFHDVDILTSEVHGHPPKKPAIAVSRQLVSLPNRDVLPRGASGEFHIAPEDGRPKTLTAEPAAQRVWIGTDRGTLLLLCSSTGRLLCRMPTSPHPIADIVALHQSPDNDRDSRGFVGQCVVADDHGGVWQVTNSAKSGPDSARVACLRKPQSSRRRAIALSADGRFFAELPEEPPIRFGRCANQTAFRVEDQVWCDSLHWSPRGHEFLSIRNGRLYFWNATDGTRRLKRRLEGNIDACRYTVDGHSLWLTLDYEGVLRVDSREGQLLERIPWTRKGPLKYEQRLIAVSPYGQTVLITEPGESIAMYEADNAQQVHTFLGHSSPLSMRSLPTNAEERPSFQQTLIVGLEFLSPSRFVSVDRSGQGYLWDLFAPSLADGFSKSDPALAQTASEETTVEQIAELWNVLGDRRTTIWPLVVRMVHAPEATLDYLESPQDFKSRILGQIERLSSPDYTIRFRAERSLRRLGLSAEPLLEQALARVQRHDTRRRIARLLVLLQGGDLTAAREQREASELRRHLRVIRILEQIATRRARQHLMKLSADRSVSRTARDAAKFAILRMRQRAGETDEAKPSTPHAPAWAESSRP